MAELAIVIPVYKSTFLAETLNSIANQTDKRFHVYIGDDCSPYDIYSIVSQFEGKIPLTYRRFETNLGEKNLVGQWERCIALTKNESYIWLFSDDDTMDSQCVESFYSHVSVHPNEEFFHFNINMIDSTNGGKILPLPRFPMKLTAGEFLELKLRGKIVSYVVEFIFSRKLYTKINGFKKFDLAWGSDFITWLKMASISIEGITTISGTNSYVNWRKSNENISPNKTQPILLRKIKAYISNASFIQDELHNHPRRYLPCKKSFRWLRFPLGEIFRNRSNLSKEEIRDLCHQYYKEVGFPLYSYFVYIFSCLIKPL